MGKHTVTSFDEDLEHIGRLVHDMSDLAGSMVGDAIRALLGSDAVLDLVQLEVGAEAVDREQAQVGVEVEVVDRLLDEESGNVADLEAFIGRTIKFQVETMYSQEQYDVVLL